MADRDVVWDEVSLLQDSLITIWRAHMRWFSWHFAIHLGALGAAVILDELRNHLVIIAVFMALFAALGAGAAWKMQAYDRAVRERVSAIRQDEAVSNSAIFGGSILEYARWATVATNIFLIGAWAYVGALVR